MPKGRTRKREAAKSDGSRPRETQVSTTRTRAQAATLRSPSGGRQRVHNLWMSAMVALGCWGFAITFVFMTNDPNRYLFGGMAALLALMWSVNFVRKWQQRRQ